jgi:hypothetical protein
MIEEPDFLKPKRPTVASLEAIVKVIPLSLV